MKVKWRENFAVKVLAFTAAVAAFAATAVMGCYQLMNLDVLWLDAEMSGSFEVRQHIYSDSETVRELLRLYQSERMGVRLDTTQRLRREALEERLDPANTNLRWQLRDRDGAVLAGYSGPDAEPQNYVVIFGYDDSGQAWTETGDKVWVYLWMDAELPVQDDYWETIEGLERQRANREDLLILSAACAAACILLTVFLCAGAGHRPGTEKVTLNWFHRLPGDVLLALFGGGLILDCVGICALMTPETGVWFPIGAWLAGLGLLAAVCGGLILGMLITFAARCKAETLFRNTLVWRLGAWMRRVVLRAIALGRRVLAAVPLMWKAAVACGCYGLFTLWCMLNLLQGEVGLILLWVVISGAGAAYLLIWATQWKRIRQGTQEIIGGNPDYHISTWRMLPDLRGHADELNNLGQTISAAVEDRMRSERFKAELITNVSHDLKTPLTSIINYVDLLKKERIDNPRAAEYIEVLERKSQRLKKLTEDLVEASKASTGNLTVVFEPLDLRQLVDQALAECGERLSEQGLTVIRILPERPVWVEADGRHLWRILDNLLTNCAKYALENTRVYVELRTGGGCVTLSVKNISRGALDLPAERLLERFVRGDASRGTVGGSGLGLSIAQSLTELQRGRFEISIDGDLFKAMVTLPLADGEPQAVQAPEG